MGEIKSGPVSVAQRVEDLPAEQLWAKWREDVERLYDELVATFALRRQYRDFMQLFAENTELQRTGGHVWNWMRTCYVNTMLIRIRRHTGGQRNEASLRQLIREIRLRPEVPTRARVVGAPQGPVDFLHGTLDAQFTAGWAAGVDAGELAPSALTAAMSQLEAAGRRTNAVANSRYIHLHPSVPDQLLSFADLDAALDEIEKVFQRFHSLVLGVGLFQLEPAPQFDTHKVFSFPWRPALTADEWIAQRHGAQPG